MTPAELNAAEEVLFACQGRDALPAALGVDSATAWRYTQREAVPGPVAAAVSTWLLLHRDFGMAPPPKPAEEAEFAELAEMASPGIRSKSGLSGFEAAAFLVFGDTWKHGLHHALGIDQSTLWRQIEGGNVKGPVRAALRAFLVHWRLTGTSPTVPPKPADKRRKKIPTYARLFLDE